MTVISTNDYFKVKEPMFLNDIKLKVKDSQGVILVDDQEKKEIPYGSVKPLVAVLPVRSP